MLKIKKHYHEGFTLIEILVAISVFIVTLIAISQVFISIIHSERIAYGLLNIENIIRNNLEYMARAIRMGRQFSVSSDGQQICFKTFQSAIEVDECFRFEPNNIPGLDFDNYNLIQSIGGSDAILIDTSKLPIKIAQGRFDLNKNLQQPSIRIILKAKTRVANKWHDFDVETAITPRVLRFGKYGFFPY